MFSKIMQNATKFKEKISQEVGDRIALSESYGALWEPSENVDKCRGCDAKFQLPFLKRKHHCRICAGVFCDSCCVLPADAVGLLFAGNQKQNAATKQAGNTNGEETSIASMRVCDGCKRCETPGEPLRNVMRALIEESRKEALTPKQRRVSRMEKKKDDEMSTVNALDRLSMLVAVRVGENVGVQFGDSHPSEPVPLSRGSAYGEDGHDVLTSKNPPKHGYFEINNKSSEYFCVKVLRKGGDQKFEVPRPSYLSVPPGDSVHSFFNEDEDDNDDESNNLEVIILYKNPNKIPSTKVYFDTTLIASSKKLSPCAKIDQFRNVTYYEIASKNQNVFLKYKGNGQIKVRMGNSLKRVGLGGVILGNRHAKNGVDFSTNVHNIHTVFTAES